ncbi:aminotransferase class V-fold PLP-dependent enzyme [Mycoplasmopsis glycophila]|uniref:Probable cysteine desulfurase n=1 Tax=Mycoplasmopsis glycophila TaxID=171285 RepID=A0A449AUS2_9BACT|nr:aminotransferase class V-fold PLP-dependent enzyme [Mycoplasmopsis glycophila]VEU70220.1 Probable cysteine desulfurase [Mycoplasmopsis glycophila]
MKNTQIRKHFPILKKITYFDSAALVLKPKSAIDANTDFYLNQSISTRTSDTPLGNIVYQTLERTREKTAKLIDASPEEVIFTSGTTESLNNFALMSKKILKKNDVILLSTYNHSSNIIPWIEVAKEVGAKIKYSENLLEDITPKTKIIAFAQETNNFNHKEEVSKIIKKAHKLGALVVSDAAQAIVHEKVSLTSFDVIVFSANKFYGPTGFGVLAIKKELLKKLSPAKFGGGSITEVDKNSNWGLKDTIAAFEPGTPNLAGFFMFEKAIDFFNTIGYDKTQKVLTKLSNYLHEKLLKLDNIDVLSQKGDYIALINVKNINSQDVATYLGSKNIYTRAGILCAPYLRNIRSEKSYLRISLGIYNNFDDIDKLIEVLKNGGDFYAF